jgi:hypothetical protein
MLVDILKIAGDCGLPIRDYRYVGMGANRFYDFLLLHKYLGLRNMVSLEHDDSMYERAIFNVPYRFIDVRNLSVMDFLASDEAHSPEILWFDYDGGIGPDIVADIASTAIRAKVGDLCFVTVSGLPPRVMESMSDANRLTALQDLLGDMAGEVELEDVERSQFTSAVHKILMASYKHGFAARTEGKFVPLLQVEYADSVPMVTVGGGFLASETAKDIARRLKKALPFLPSLASEMYHIRSFHLTERERALFDRATTSPKKRCFEKNTLKAFGFREADFEAYSDLLRYLPRYVETAV